MDGSDLREKNTNQARSQNNSMNSRCDWWTVLLKSIMNCFVKINHSNCAVESAVVSCTNETGSTFSCLYLLQGQKSHLYPLKLYCHKSWTPVVNKYQYMFCVLDASEYKVQNHQVQDCGGYSTGLYCLRTPQHLSGKHTTAWQMRFILSEDLHLINHSCDNQQGNLLRVKTTPCNSKSAWTSGWLPTSTRKVGSVKMVQIHTRPAC